MPTEPRPLCAVIDTNVWRSQLLLKTNLGAALLHAVRRRNGVIGLPEVVEMEIRKHIVKVGEQAAAEAAGGFETIRILTGQSPAYEPPSAAAFEQAVDSRLGEMKDFLVRVEFTMDHARSALDMVNWEQPPSSKNNQQFKDSAIWQALLHLSQSYDVVFVSEDKGFFEGREPKKGLARNLQADCSRVGGKIQVYNNLAACLEVLQKDAPSLDFEKLAAMIADHLRFHLTETAGNRGFALGDMIGSSLSPFATETIGLLAIGFKLTYRLSDVAPPDAVPRSDATLRVVGDCSFSEGSGAMGDMAIEHEEFQWTNAEGETRTGRNIYLRATIGTGHVSHKVRYPIKQMEPESHQALLDCTGA